MAAGIAAPAYVPASADAQFVTPQCVGAQASGAGSSLQAAAQAAWAFTFSHDNNSICPQGTSFDPQNASYQALGSGYGLLSVCVNGLSFQTNPATGAPYDFAATDDPPLDAAINNANNCLAAASVPLELHTIPVAQAGIAIVVHLPTGCTINAADNAATGNRFDVLNANLESAFFNGSGAATWSTLLPHSPSCSGPITRAVRYDESGTTFQTERYLAQLNGNDSLAWVNAAGNVSPQDAWPNNGSNIVYGGTTPGNPNASVCTAGLSGSPAVPPATGAETAAETSDCNGAGNLAQAVLDTPGSIGYADLATAVSKGFGYPTKGTASTFWVPVQNDGTGTTGATFADPNLNSNGYISGNATGGADCFGTPYTPPTGGDPTLASWSSVIGSNPNQARYPICTLTYELLFNDNSKAFGDNAANDARSRSVKDYIEYILSNTVANDGQNILRSLSYDALPANILSVARTGANSITWSGVN